MHVIKTFKKELTWIFSIGFDHAAPKRNKSGFFKSTDFKI